MDKKTISNLIKEGKTYQEIGKIFNVSRQRIHQIYKEYTSSPKTKITHIDKNWKPSKMINCYNNLEGREHLRELVRQRDNYTCQICGKVWQEGQRRFDVHHINEKLEGKEGRKYGNNKDFDKMITLCHKCHLGLECVRSKMQNANRG
jgi:hypothetical protein